jgi:hypothetical protein
MRAKMRQKRATQEKPPSWISFSISGLKIHSKIVIIGYFGYILSNN